MNSRQVVDRVVSLLSSRLWGGYVGESGVGSKVFGTVVGSVDETEEQLAGLQLPAALVFPGSGDHDEDEPTLMTRQIAVAVISQGSGDMAGRSALLGHGRTSATATAGAGLLDLEGELYGSLASTNEREGIRAWSVGNTVPQPGYVKGIYILKGIYIFQARMTTFLERQQPSTFTASGSPAVTLTWTAPTDTTSLTEYRVRRVSGHVPTPFVDGGTAVTLGSPTDVTVNDSPGVGTWTYSVFAGYDTSGGSTGFEWSNNLHKTVAVT